MRIIFILLFFVVLLTSKTSIAAFQVGVSAVDITPYQFERRPLDFENPFYGFGDDFYDTGVDGLFDFEELGALGLDAKPGRAGIDDDNDGIVDNCDRLNCAEYAWPGSDDVFDPHQDNDHEHRNPAGTEKDEKFQFLHLAGFRPAYPSFMPNRYAVGVHDPIWARALFIRGSNGVDALFISTDLPGLTWKHINPVRRSIEEKLGIPQHHIFIASTHNHSAPDAAGYWTTLLDDNNKWYTDRLRTWIFESAEKAIQNLTPAAYMKTITTTHFSCYNTQTKELKKEPFCNLPVSQAAYEDEDEAQKYDTQIIQTDLRDPIVRNTRIVAAQFVDSSGQTIATFVNWNNHPDTLSGKNMLISSDYSHYLRRFIERELGGIAIYFTGTLGNQIGLSPEGQAPLWNDGFERVYSQDRDIHGNLVPEFTNRGWDKIRSVGYEIGSEVVEALQASTDVLDKIDIQIKTEPVDTNVDTFIHRYITSSVWEFDVDEDDRLRRYGDRCRKGPGCIRSDISIIQVGDLGMVTLPGEVDPAYLLGRKAAEVSYGFPWGTWEFPAIRGFDSYIPGKHHVVLGQTNNYLSYLVPLSDNHGTLNYLHPNHYEESVTVSKYLGDDLANKVAQLLEAPFRYSDREILPKNPWGTEEDLQEEQATARTQNMFVKHFGYVFLKFFEKEE